METTLQQAQNRKSFKIWFWISFALNIVAFYFSATAQRLFRFEAVNFSFANLVPACAALIVVSVAALPFYKAAVSEIRDKKPSDFSLLSLAILVSAGLMVYDTCGQLFAATNVETDSALNAVTLVSVLLFAKWLETSFISKVLVRFQNLIETLPDHVQMISGQETKELEISRLQVGDIVAVAPGSVIPADGVVLQGTATLDESLVLGQLPFSQKSVGDSVFAATASVQGSKRNKGVLTMRVTAVGSQTLAADITRVVGEGQSFVSKGQVWAEKAKVWLFYLTVAVALLAGGFWAILATSNDNLIVETVVAVLVISSGQSLGLAQSLVTWVGTSRAARSGLLIKNQLDFRTLKNSKIALFAMTGTLTAGRKTLVATKLSAGSMLGSEDDLLQLAASAEAKSNHSIANVILETANLRGLQLLPVANFVNMQGRGVSAQIGDFLVQVGSPALLTTNSVNIHAQDLFAVAEANSRANTVVYVLANNEIAGFLEFADELKEDSIDAIAALKKIGVRPALVTGDATGVAAEIADRLQIDQVFAEVMPVRQAEIVKQLQADGSPVVFVADAVTDAAGLAQADVGLAAGSSTNLSIQSAGLVILNTDPSSVVQAIRLAKRTSRTVHQNVAWSICFNILGLAAAAGAFAFAGLLLTPVVCAVLMSLSTVIVAANAQLLRR